MNGPRTFQPRKSQKEQLPPHNHQIRGKEVRIVQSDPIQSGIYPLIDAIKLAQEQGMDLVAFNLTQEIPICRIVSIDKFMYEQKQKQKEQKKQSAASEVKEIRLSPDISDNDVAYRVKSACEWLQRGDKVKCTLQFKGRQIMHKERGELVLLQFADAVKDYGIPESLPKLEGKKMFMMLKPKGKK